MQDDSRNNETSLDLQVRNSVEDVLRGNNEVSRGNSEVPGGNDDELRESCE